MKYFTKEVCFFGINAGKARCEKAEKMHKSNCKKYDKNLLRILPKMPKKYRSFFEKNSQLGDGAVHQILFGSLPKNLHLLSKKDNYVEIYVTNIDDGRLYVLKYKRIRKCILDFPSKEIIYHEEDQSQLGEWYADELCMTKDEWFTHEIIFNSGATLYLEFKKFSYTRTKKILKTMKAR